jgi:hypothetical protein
MMPRTEAQCVDPTHAPQRGFIKNMAICRAWLGFLLIVRANRFYRRVRLLFHDPMPGIRDNAAFNIGGNLAHDFGWLRSKRLFRAQRQNRHGQLTFAGERLVVGRVL